MQAGRACEGRGEATGRVSRGRGGGMNRLRACRLASALARVSVFPELMASGFLRASRSDFLKGGQLVEISTREKCDKRIAVWLRR